MTAKKKGLPKAAKKKPAPRRKKERKEWRPFPPPEEPQRERVMFSWDPDPIPFSHVRYFNNSDRPTLVSVVLEPELTPPETLVIPQDGQLVPPGVSMDVPCPLMDVERAYGTVLYEVGGIVRSHAFDGGYGGFMTRCEIETLPRMRTIVRYYYD